MKRNNKKGFTIVELVIVIAVIAILAAVLIPTFVGITKKANESSDIQAIREMNMFLAVADITDGVDSILDVYDCFEESGFAVENYSPLYEGRTFYYDVQYKKILYVENETGKVVFPEEHKDETQGTHDWFTLSMEIETIAITPDTSVEGTEKYSVSSAGEYAYIAEKLNKSFPANTNVIIDLQSNLDLKGACITINEVPAGATLTINGNEKTIKNITANTFTSTGEGEDANRKYIVAGLIGEACGSVSITNVTLDNINVKDINAGNVALLVGSMAGESTDGKDVTFSVSNVAIKNSTVIGHRSVGALAGMLYYDTNLENLTLENVNVYTVGGRSGLLFGWVSTNPTISGLDSCAYNNATFSIYECEQNAGGITEYTENEIYNNDFFAGPANATKNIHSYSIETNGEKKYRDYGFNPDALYCKWPGTVAYYYFVLIN